MEHILRTLRLTFGQVAWAICAGQTPDGVTIERLRYLRRLEVPFPKKDQIRGSGNRQTYEFDHLVECALGVYALKRRLKPAGVAKSQVGERDAMRAMAREQFLKTTPEQFSAPWVKSRGTISPPLGEELYLRFHDRVFEQGTYEVVTFEELSKNKDFSFGDLIEHFSDGDTRPLVPLRRVMLPAVAWALEAPVTRPGPR